MHLAYGLRTRKRTLLLTKQVTLFMLKIMISLSFAAPRPRNTGYANGKGSQVHKIRKHDEPGMFRCDCCYFDRIGRIPCQHILIISWGSNSGADSQVLSYFQGKFDNLLMQARTELAAHVPRPWVQIVSSAAPHGTHTHHNSTNKKGSNTM